MGNRSVVIELADFVAAHSAWVTEGFKRCEVRIEHACGHLAVASLLRSTPPADIKQRFLAARCAACETQSLSTYAKLIADATHRAKQLRLPQLAARSDKQRDYAIVLRDRAVARHGLDVPRDALQHMTDAEWWIDNRARLAHAKVFRTLDEDHR